MMAPLRRRALLLAMALSGTAAVAALVRPEPPGPGDIPDPRLDELFPARFGPWSTDPLMRSFVRAVDQNGRILGVYDRLFEQTYIDDRGYRVMLSVAYLGQAFEGASMQLHRPEVCYRYGGYTVGPTSEARLPAAGRNLPVNRLHAELPGRSEPITYWILVGDRAVESHGSLRRRRILAALGRERLDSMLVRVSSIDRDIPRAYRVHQEFVDALARNLSPIQRRRVFGAAPGAAT